MPITLIDTAGLRQTEDQIEAAGVRQAQLLGQNADLLLALEDGHAAREALELPEGVPTLRVQTKADLGLSWHEPHFIAVSAVTGEGLPELREAVRAALLGDVSRGEAWLTTERQADAAGRALTHLSAARALPDDLASYELELALSALAELTGRDVQDDVVDAVFRNFCVGK